MVKQKTTFEKDFEEQNDTWFKDIKERVLKIEEWKRMTNWSKDSKLKRRMHTLQTKKEKNPQQQA